MKQKMKFIREISKLINFQNMTQLLILKNLRFGDWDIKIKMGSIFLRMIKIWALKYKKIDVEDEKSQIATILGIFRVIERIMAILKYTVLYKIKNSAQIIVARFCLK